MSVLLSTMRDTAFLMSGLHARNTHAFLLGFTTLVSDNKKITCLNQGRQGYDNLYTLGFFLLDDPSP